MTNFLIGIDCFVNWSAWFCLVLLFLNRLSAFDVDWAPKAGIRIAQPGPVENLEFIQFPW